MRVVREWLHRLAGTLLRRRCDTDLEEELRLHLEMATEDARNRGLEPAAAVRAAQVKTGAASQAMDALRDQRGLPWLDDLARDVSLAAAKVGFARQEVAPAPPGRPTEIRLRRAAALSGRVVDAFGDPVASAQVVVETRDAQASLPVVRVTQTDDRGEYRVGSLSPVPSS
jgi:hypothetical protein